MEEGSRGGSRGVDSTFGLTGVDIKEGEQKLGGKGDDSMGLDDRFIAEIMMSLDSAKIATLRKAFEQNDDDGLR